MCASAGVVFLCFLEFRFGPRDCHKWLRESRGDKGFLGFIRCTTQVEHQSKVRSRNEELGLFVYAYMSTIYKYDMQS